MNNKYIVTLLSTILLGLVSYVDFLLGHRLSFSLFYLVPISLMTWYHSRTSGIILSVLSGLIWFYIDLAVRSVDTTIWIMIWNAVLRFGFFIVTTWLIAALRSVLYREQDLARKDHLTHTWNRRAFYEMAEIEVARARRYNHPLSLVYIDLDNFKAVNDVFGHSVGDSLLQRVVELVVSHIRKTDIFSRLGGDEFALLLPETRGVTARILLDRIRSDLLKEMHQQNWPVTFSIGIVSYLRPPEELKKIVQEADTLMYSVKRSTKNKIELLSH